MGVKSGLSVLGFAKNNILSFTTLWLNFQEAMN